jgi:hypothetical protein
MIMLAKKLAGQARVWVLEFNILCHDSPEFRPVYDQLAEETSQAEMIDRLLEHANRHLQLDRLLAVVKTQNPARYAAHQPYYNRTELEAELAKVEQGMAAQENLRGDSAG